MEEANRVWEAVVSFLRKAKESTAGKACATMTALLVARHLMWKAHARWNRLPPGPVGLPVLGSLPALARNQPEFFSALVRQYGPLSRFNFGPSRTICVVADSKTLSDMLRRKEMLDHESGEDLAVSLEAYKIEAPNLMQLNGERWRYVRKLLHTSLVLMLRAEVIEHATSEALVTEVTPEIERAITEGKPWSPKRALSFVAFANVFYVSFGMFLSADEPGWTELEVLHHQMMHNAQPSVFANMLKLKLPMFAQKWLVVPGLLNGIHGAAKLVRGWLETHSGYVIDKDGVIRRVEGHPRAAHQDVEEEQSFIDRLVAAHWKNPDKFPAAEVLRNVNLMFVLGQDTTSNSTEYALGLLAKHGAVQRELREELVAALGGAKVPFTLKVLPKLHKFRAFVHESLRMSTVARAGFPRVCQEDIEVTVKETGRTYKIPKGQMVLPLYYFGKDDEASWGPGAEEMDINRWLDAKGEFHMHPSFVAFSSGKRDCVGRHVATKTMYVLLARLMLAYDIAGPGGPDDRGFEFGQDFDLVRKVYPTLRLTMTPRA